MTTEVLMPALSPTMTEGKLSRWLVKEGDEIKSGKVLCEIETDKATMEVEAVDEGTLLKILVAEGSEGVAVNTPIAALGNKGEIYTPSERSATTAYSAPKTPAVTSSTPATTSPPTHSAHPQPMVMREGQLKVSPVAKRIAQERGVNLYSVVGSGPDGRIVKEDVLSAIAQTSASPAPKSTGASPPPSPATPKAPDAKQLADLLGQKYTEHKNSITRKTIAKRLTESKQTVPHFYLSVDCELDALLTARMEVNKKANAKVSVNDMVIKATALALREIPAANASWTDDAILRYADVDISVAVAIPDGLITPIIKKADTKSVMQISKEMKDLAARAKENKLKPEEFQGGGFSVSNLGMFGVKHFAAIINPPQGCILAIGAGERRAVVKPKTGLFQKEIVEIATVMTCTLAVDHRVVDGAVGAQFLGAFKKLIESPAALVA